MRVRDDSAPQPFADLVARYNPPRAERNLREDIRRVIFFERARARLRAMMKRPNER